MYYIFFSVSPTQLEVISAELRAIKFKFTSPAHALANRVFPVPGGPYISIPFHGLREPTNISGCYKGNKTAYFKAVLALAKPAISSNLITSFFLLDTFF